nr:TonB family protein [Deltaproteobacteria bacterium]
MSKEIAGPVKENWKYAFTGAVGIHLVLALLAMVAPNLWERSRPMPPVYTVKLFETLDQPAPKRAEPKRPAPTVKTKPKIKKAEKKEVKVAPKPTGSKPKPKKTVSLHPKEPKIAKRPEPRPVDTKYTEKLLNKRLKNIKEKVQEKELEARLSALKSSVEDRKKESAIPAAGTAAESGGQNEALRLYCIDVWAKVRNQWVLPEQLLDKTGLTSIVIVRIAQDGTVLKAEYEHKSGHALFDRSAMGAVQRAAPFPPLPRALRPGPLEIGIRFKPGEVGL